MRTILLPALLAFFATSIRAQVKWLNPRPAGFANEKIIFINDHTGYIINENGDLFITSDTGTSWQLKQNFPGAKTFAFNDSTAVIPTRNGYLYVSSDKGNSWQGQSPGISGGYLEDWSNVVGRDTVFLIQNLSGSRKLYKSVNRGLSFQPIGNYLPPIDNISINFITSMRGYAAAGGGVYKTVDGGTSWQLVYNAVTSPGVGFIKFRDTANGFAFRGFSTIMKTTNAGVSWTEAPVESQVTDIFWVNSSVAYAVGNYGFVTKTTNGGNSWANVTNNAFIDANDLYTQYFLNDSTGIVTGSKGRIGKTTNSGNAWTSYSPFYTDVADIAFGDANNGYAVTDKYIYKTTDKGQHWIELPLKARQPDSDNGSFDHLLFWSKDTGMVTASNPGRIYRTTDGGQHWDSIVPTFPYGYEYITSISFVNRDTGYMEFYDSNAWGLFKTNNGGDNWQQVGSYQQFTKIQFLNNLDGFAIYDNQAYRTHDAGEHWDTLTIPTVFGLNNLWFTSPAKGFLIYDGNYFKMTTDSGTTWTDVNLIPPTGYTYYEAVRFINNDIGYLTDDDGYIYKTLDAGYHWDVEGKIANHSYFYSRVIQFYKDSSVYFGSLDGTILTTDVYRVDTATVCSNGSYALAYPFTGNTWQWQVNTGIGYTNITDGSNYSGATSPYLFLTNIPGTWNGYRYRCIINGIPRYEFVLKPTNHWTGTISVAWENPGNWSCGTLPDIYTNVVIDNGPVIVHSSPTINSLTLNTGVVFTVNTGFNITILH